MHAGTRAQVLSWIGEGRIRLEVSHRWGCATALPPSACFSRPLPLPLPLPRAAQQAERSAVSARGWLLGASARPISNLPPHAPGPHARPALARRFELAQAREAFATLLQRKVLG